MDMLDFLPVIGKAADAVLGLLPDPRAREEHRHEIERILAEAVFQAAQGQIETNRVEAAHASVLVAGWRPFIGWICGCALAWQYVLRPLWSWVAGIWLPDVPAPAGLDDSLWELMFGMLGIGGLRTFEKVKGVAR